MTITIDATYENGVLVPAQPLAVVVLRRLGPAVGARQARRDPFTRLSIGTSPPFSAQAGPVLLAPITVGAETPRTPPARY